MENLHWQLSVLSRAIHYKNLSGAALHIGLSQPQLSRIILRLEQELKVVLLDRTAKRKSGWTPVAHKIAKTYFHASRKLTQSLQAVQNEAQIKHISIGILEGLMNQGLLLCQKMFAESMVQHIEIDVFDLNDLEEKFIKDEIDIILTCREPAKHKFHHQSLLGFQSMQPYGREASVSVMSLFEYSNIHSRSKPTHPKDEKIFISNSMALRKQWIDQFGGTAMLPTPIYAKKQMGATELPVYMIASELISPVLWQKIEGFKLEE